MSGLLRRFLERQPVAMPLLRRAAMWQVRRAVRSAGCDLCITSDAVDICRGAQEWLRTHRPRWVMDTNHRIGDKFTDARVERILTACGYHAWTELIAGFRTTFAVPEEFKP